MRMLERDNSRKTNQYKDKEDFIDDEEDSFDFDDDDFGLTEGLNLNNPSPPKVKKVNTESQKYKELNFDDDEDEEDDYSTPPSSKPKQTKKPRPEPKKSNGGKIVLVIIVVLMVAICFILYSLATPENDKTANEDLGQLNPTTVVNNTNNETSTATANTNKESQNNSTTESVGGTLVKEDDNGNPIEIVDNKETSDASTNVNIGTPNFKTNTNMQSNTPVENYNNFVKDIEGKDVAVDYTVSRIDTVSDFVNYTKHRGVTGTGIELYWLEATYLDRPYVIQVPFKVFKELGDTGIIPVRVEILYLKDGSQIVSYMEVDTEYNSTKSK